MMHVNERTIWRRKTLINVNLKASCVECPPSDAKKCVTLTKWLRRGWFRRIHFLLEPMNFDN